MAFVDELKIYAIAGAGGDGVVRWRQEKFIPKGGPAGGDGGRGGDFYVRAVRDIGILSRYVSKKKFEAERGQDGGGKSLHGKNGEDYILELPIGSVITNTDNDQSWRLENVDEKILILKGGRGGWGNEHFKSSTNTTPRQSTKGTLGQDANLYIELELFADVGLVGLPNAGKSSLLNMLTNAKAKVGSYAFTTLDPNLGDLHGYIVADIPGIIEGASSGKGLGVKFLKHIKRTKMLAHLVSFGDDADIREQYGGKEKSMMDKYKEVRNELEQYDQEHDLGEHGLATKDEIIILTKCDIVDDPRIITDAQSEFSALGKKVFVLSLFDDKMVKEFNDELVKILNNE